MITNEDFLEMYCYPHTKAEASKALEDLIASKPKPEGKTKEGIKMQLSDSSIQVQLYGNDGNDGQEVIKGDKAKEHLIKWIYGWIDEAIAEHEADVITLYTEWLNEKGYLEDLHDCHRNKLLPIDFITKYKNHLNGDIKDSKHEVYSEEGCIFNYCPYPEICKNGGCVNKRLPTPYKDKQERG